jgi:hypothetical protein
MDKDKILDLIKSLLDAVVGDSKQPTPNHVESAIVEQELEVVKSVVEHEQRAMFIVLEPQEDDGTTADAHGDWYSAEEIAKACRDFNVACRKAGLMHSQILDDDVAVIEESYTAPVDFKLENGETVKKGTWVQWWHIKDPMLWQGVLDGEYDSVSIECSATGFTL